MLSLCRGRHTSSLLLSAYPDPGLDTARPWVCRHRGGEVASPNGPDRDAQTDPGLEAGVGRMSGWAGHRSDSYPVSSGRWRPLYPRQIRSWLVSYPAERLSHTVLLDDLIAIPPSDARNNYPTTL